MEERSADHLRAAIRAHQERMLIERGCLCAWLTIAGLVVLWALSASHVLERAGSPIPLLNSIELCILTVAVTQVQRPWWRRHVIGLSTIVGVELVAFLALYGWWTGNLWIFSLRMIVLSLVTAAVLPWGIAAQGVVMATSTLAFALVHWNLNGTLDHPSTFPTLIVFVLSVPMAFFLEQAHAKLASEVERRQAAEGALRRATEIARVAVWSSDLRTLTIHFSSGWKSLLGRNESESTLAQWWELVHPDDRTKATAAVQAHLQNRTSFFENEQRMLHADGSYRWVLTRGTIAYDSEGQPCGQYGADIDITERKQMEATLQEARTWLQLATESAKVALWACDLRTLTMRFSSGRKRVLGRDDNEIPLAEQWDLVHPDDRTQAIATLQAHFQTRTSLYENERRMLHADGSYRWVLIRSTTVYDSEGQPCVQYGADIDITERKQLEEAVRCSEEKYRQLVEDIGEVIYAIDASGILTYVSPVAEALYGYAPAEIVNRPYTDFVPAEDVPRVAQGFAETVSGMPDLRVHRIMTKAGDIRWVRNSARGVAEAGGIGLRGVLTDVTERRRIEHELQALTKELDARVIERTRQLSEALEQVDAGRERLKMLSQRLIEIQETERRHFARELHDEIGQMLTGLQFLLHGLRDLPPAAAKQITEAQQLISDLCGQVRDLSLELRPAMLDDLGLLPALMWLFGRYAMQTGITVAFEHCALQQRFPGEQETAAYRIVQEALTNVARHARVTAVTVRAWVEDGVLGVQIADEGIGFDAKKALAAGTSGGLPGMRERALLVGGTLRITSVPGGRTEVSVYIPTS